MLCPKCNTQNQLGSTFCTNCGNPFFSQVPVISNQSTTLFNSGKKWVIISGIVLLLVLNVIGVLVMSVTWKNNSTSSLNNSNSFQLTTQPTVIPQATKSKYDIDSDGDSIPDFVETALGWNPKQVACSDKISCGNTDINNQNKKQKNILLILDSSGSMAEVVSGEQKMAAAKRVIKDYINTLPQNINVGLMVYGNHGSNSASDKAVSCAGIDLLYSLSVLDKTKFISAVNSFQPTGWTPIGGSLRKAKTDVFAGHEEENNYIVIITDGIETCDSDPIGAVNELKNSGIQPIINVVGFAVGSADQVQLQQIANLGGGKFYSVNNAQDLADVLGNIQKEMDTVVSDIACLNATLAEYVGCLQDRFVKAQDYLAKIRDDAFKTGNVSEGTKANDAITHSAGMMSKLQSIMYQQTDTSDKVKKVQELLNQQKQKANQ